MFPFQFGLKAGLIYVNPKLIFLLIVRLNYLKIFFRKTASILLGSGFIFGFWTYQSASRELENKQADNFKHWTTGPSSHQYH